MHRHARGPIRPHRRRPRCHAQAGRAQHQAGRVQHLGLLSQRDDPVILCVDLLEFGERHLSHWGIHRPFHPPRASTATLLRDELPALTRTQFLRWRTFLRLTEKLKSSPVLILENNTLRRKCADVAFSSARVYAARVACTQWSGWTDATTSNSLALRAGTHARETEPQL